MGELEVLPSATVLSVQYMMRSRPNVEFGLKIVDVCKAQVHTIRQEEILGEKQVRLQRGAPQMVEIGAAFQNRLQFDIGVETMNDGQKH